LKDEKRLTTFLVGGSDSRLPVNFDALIQNVTIQQVNVCGLKQVESNQIFFQLAMAIKSHPRVTRLLFCTCEISDLGALCVALTQKNQPVKLQFSNCRLQHCAAETLRLMLEANLVDFLHIERCKGDDTAAVQLSISLGLGKNKSLKVLHLHRNALDLNVGLHEMLVSNRNLVELDLSLAGNRQWDLFRSLEKLKTLTSLCLCCSKIDLQSMEAIMTMCLVVHPLQTLSFSACNCDQNALEFLVRTLSSNKIIKTLKYDDPPRQLVSVDFGTLQVENLMFEWAKFENSTLAQMIDSIANNQHIKCLSMNPGRIGEEGFEKVCDTLLRQNKGPSELIIEIDENDASLITGAMEGNTNLKALKVDAVGESNMITLAEGVMNMPGLRKLAFTSDCDYSEDFFAALLASMERNTSLWTLSFENVNVDTTNANKYLPRIRYLLALNRVGRHAVMIVPIPVGLWPHVLEKSTNELDGIYFVLTEKPDIVTPTRKRKHRSDG
jgi:hypothetical protein